MSSPPSVQTRVLRASSGPQIKAGDRVWVWYAGERLDGTRFDANFNFTSFSAEPNRSPFPFILGIGQVISGWDQALAGRRLGEVLELTIPSDLAYGSAGIPPAIPADADLRFIVELLASGNPGQYTFPTFSEIGVDLSAAAALAADLDAYTFRIGLDGADHLIGSTISDGLAALGGDDILSGLDGDDLLLGGGGDDRLAGGQGKDLLDGGNGSDTAAFGSTDNTVNLSLTAPQPTGEGLDSLVSIESVDAGDGNDQVTGNGLANSIGGGKGNDVLSGGGGSDRLSGGAGADQFLYGLSTESGKSRSERDTITDFNGREGDRIDLAAIDAHALQPGNQAFRFIGSQPFTAGRPGEASFSAGLLQLNLDASKTADMVITLSGVNSLPGRFLIL
ncbi:MAG: FKBP-type peptidyl-prolyl cis-trans isomerase [Cyanobium sp.]